MYGLGKGTSDLIGFTLVNGQAIFTALEVKTAKGTATDSQYNYIDMVNQNGGIAAIVRSWEDVEEMGLEMDYDAVMIPVASGDALEKVIINMDSHVLKNYKSKTKNINEEQLKTADSKYIASVYFHTLFLYTITKKQKYALRKLDEHGEETSVDIADYLKDVFQSYYSEFILNFGGMEQLMQSLGD